MTAIRSIADSVISSSQCHPITHEADPAILALATPAIINPVAVANIETVLGAVLPDRVLNEPGEGLRKVRVELPGIDPLGYGCNNVGAATGSVAGRTIQVVRVEPMQDPGPVQKVMNQGINRDHGAADLGPEDHFLGSAEQQAG